MPGAYTLFINTARVEYLAFVSRRILVRFALARRRGGIFVLFISSHSVSSIFRFPDESGTKENEEKDDAEVHSESAQRC